MVMTAPMIKQARAIRGRRPDEVSFAPTRSPMGIMAMSAPRVKKPIPTIRKAAPARNNIRGSSGMGVIVMQRSSTIQVTGRTQERDSEIFSFNFLFKQIPPTNWILPVPQARIGRPAFPVPAQAGGPLWADSGKRSHAYPGQIMKTEKWTIDRRSVRRQYCWCVYENVGAGTRLRLALYNDNSLTQGRSFLQEPGALEKC